MTAINIRPAGAEDLPAMHALMYELAVYEQSPESVEATVEEYRQDFGNGFFEGLIAESEGRVVGMALYFMAYSSWKGKMLYLDDLVVTEAYRRRGIGQLLLDAFLAEARRRGCRLAKWQVLDWNQPAVDFYKKNQAVIETDWWNVKIFTGA
jgi:GNAT superfamily N-acetyltransferase